MSNFKAIYDCVFTHGKYTDDKGGTKYNSSKVGTVFEDENGNLSMKLDLVPVATDGKGMWFKLFDRRDRENKDRTQQ